MKVLKLFLVLWKPVSRCDALLAARGRRDRLGAGLDWHGMIRVEEVERSVSI